MHLGFNKKILYSSGVALNSYFFFKTVEANQNYNNCLANLPADVLEKIKARNWFLKQYGNFFGCGNAIAERADVDMYNAKSTEEKNFILVKYRCEQLDTTNSSMRKR